MNATTVGVDLAKNVFVACVADGVGRVVETREFNRAGFLAWLPTLPHGTIVAMEACGGAHCWGRTMQALGLEPRLMAAEFVRPYRKRQAVKNDRADAAAIVAALLAPGMRFIPVKTEAQQQRLAWHSLRLGWIEERTALLNRIRGLLAEFGMVVDTGALRLRRKLAEHEFDTAQPAPIRHLIQGVRDQFDALDLRIAECDRQIAAQQADDAAARRARELPGVGMLTADAVVASVGDATMFHNGRQFAAWLGLTPSQYSSGGKPKLGRITRRGDDYLRTLLVQGARSVLAAALRKARNTPEALTRLQQWIVTLNGRIGYHKTLVAIANKHARQLWAVLAKGEGYNPEAWHQWHDSVEQPAS
ncbi:Transposase [Aromatoleum tolulyticum]|uniref:Transposase n=1 Tax=Aromatoleum tolulyticum TaxID=34027 RepID=A0A1N7ADF8_9RHOO|nr:IS110 family transposase [Aromatoleum tolulyticum]SIR37210.1 Transposase [Aromatoleum tolulyticum]